MEHLFTSFFRSSVAGSFKEHRMVFQTPAPGRIESVAVAEQRQKEMVDRLNNPNDVQAAADARVLSISLALSRDLDTARIDAAKAALDARITARESAESAVKALKDQHDGFRKTEGDALRGAVGAAREPIVEKLLRGPTPAVAPQIPNASSVLEAMNKIRELSATPAADRGLMQDKLIAQYRDHVRELQNITGLTPAEKNKLTNPFSAETAADVGSKERLGKAYLRGEAGVNVIDDNNYQFRKVIAGTTIDIKFTWEGGPGNKWKIESVNPAVAVTDIGAATDTFEQAPFNAAPWNVATSEHNTERLRLKQILTNMKEGVVTPVPAGLERVQTVANTAEALRAQTAIDNARKAHRDFIANDADAGWSGVVRRLRAGETANQPEVVAARKDDIRALGATRKGEIYTAIQNLNSRENPTPPPPRLEATNIQSSKYAEHMALLVEQLADIDDRVSKLTAAPRPATGPDATRIDTPATGPLRPRMDGRNIVIDGIVPPTAQVLVTRPGSTTPERMTAVAGVIRIENAPAGAYRFNSGTQNAEITVPAAPEAAPVSAEVTRFLGSETERNTLRDAMRTNIANLNVDAVRNAVATFQGRLAAVPEAQRVAAVARLNETVRTPASATADGVEIALNGANLEARRIARTPATPPTAPEAKERRERMSEFIKVLIELVRALLQIEQARSASIDRFLTRSLEQQQKFMNDMQAQMKAVAARGGVNSPEYRALEGRYKSAQEQIKTLEARVKEMESRYDAAVKAARGTGTLEVRWAEADRKASRPPVVCVRAGVRATPSEIAADIAVVRREIPLVPTTVVGAPTVSGVPSTAFYVGSINVDNRATTNATITNSPGARIDATTVARTDVAPTARVTPVVRTDAPPPPPRVTGSGRRNEGSLNG